MLQNYWANAQRASDTQSERPLLQRWKFGGLAMQCNTMDGGNKAILLFSKTEPKLLHLLFASSPAARIAFGRRLQRRTESLSQGFKPFRRPHQAVAKTILPPRRHWNSDPTHGGSRMTRVVQPLKHSLCHRGREGALR